MAISVTCPGCSAKMKAPDAAAGKKVKCPKCQGSITVPAEEVPDFEVVEDEPAAPAKKPAPAAAAKPKVKVDVEVDEDEEDEKPKKKPVKAVVEDDEDEDEKPRKKKPKAEDEEDEEERKPKKKAKVAVEEDDEEDEKPKKSKKATAEDDDEDEKPTKKKKKKKKREDEEGGVSMTRNIIMGVVLLILIGVVIFVFWDKFGKSDEKSSSNTPSGDPPSSSPGPPGGGPGPKGPNVPIIPGPGPKGLGGKEDLYAGVGLPSGVAQAEEDAQIDQVATTEAFADNPKWFMTLKKENAEGRQTYTARVYLRPDQHSKVANLWPDQKIKVRGQRTVPRDLVGMSSCEFYAAEILSTGPAPKFVEMTVDQLLKEFRDDRTAAEKKWTRPIGGPDPPWIKVTGVHDGPGPDTGGFSIDNIQLKGDESDGDKPNRLLIDTPGVVKPLVKNLKKGDRITVRIRNLASASASADQVRFLGSEFPPPK